LLTDGLKQLVHAIVGVQLLEVATEPRDDFLAGRAVAARGERPHMREHDIQKPREYRLRGRRDVGVPLDVCRPTHMVTVSWS
jgi:hypothetical protein